MVVKTNQRGFWDWIIQRVTAILIGAYAIFLMGYFIMYQPIYFAQWHGLYNHILMKCITFIVILSVLWHAWIGLWTVLTDYVKNKALRLLLEIIIFILLAGYFAFAIETLWGLA
jgi:succinate dehydrogenase / fumarate reductase, membrane anchor subunit